MISPPLLIRLPCIYYSLAAIATTYDTCIYFVVSVSNNSRSGVRIGLMVALISTALPRMNQQKYSTFSE